MGGSITLRAIDNIAEKVNEGDFDASKFWINKTKVMDKRYDPKHAENKFEPNPVTGVFEVVEPDSIAGSLLGPEVELDDEDLDALLYAQDPDINGQPELPGADQETEAGTESQAGHSVELPDEGTV